MCNFLASDEQRLMMESLRAWRAVAEDLADALVDAGFPDPQDGVAAWAALCRFRALRDGS